tara:strand:+ start:254 stop:637 length:384 start_codon:yes stop_codon:yes gene_type:complete
VVAVVEYLVDRVVLEDPAEAAEKMVEVDQEIHHRLVHLKEIAADHQVTLLEQEAVEQVLLEVLLEVKMVVMVVQVQQQKLLVLLKLLLAVAAVEVILQVDQVETQDLAVVVKVEIIIMLIKADLLVQ